MRRSFYLLARLPLAARHIDFRGELRKLGLEVGEAPTLHEITSALLEAIDEWGLGPGSRSDFGEMAALSAAESLQALVSRSLTDLFGLKGGLPGRTKKIIAGLATVKQFGVLARDFFTRLLTRHLDYYLSRELPNHVGLSKRFHSAREITEFENAIERHCHEAAGIVRVFAGEWHSKTNYQQGITEKNSASFLHVAFAKLAKELEIRSESGA